MRGCLTLFLALALFVVAPLSLLAFNTQSALLSPDTYRQALREEVLRPALIESLSEAMSEEAPSEAIPPEQVVGLLEDLVPAGWIDEQIHRNIEVLLEWIDSDRNSPDIRVDLRPIKNNLPQAIAGLVTEVWESIPPCAEGEFPDLSADLPSCRLSEMEVEQFVGAPWEQLPTCGPGQWPPSDPTAYPDCRPEAIAPQEFLASWWTALPNCPPELAEPPSWTPGAPPACRFTDLTLEETFSLADPLNTQDMSSGIPDEFTLADLETGESEEGPLGALQRFRSLARAGRLASYAGLGLSAFLLGVIALLSAFSKKAFFGRVGAVILGAGLISLGVSGTLAASPGLFSLSAQGTLSGAPAALAPLVGQLLRQLLGSIATPMTIESLVLSVIGSLMLMVRFVLGRRTSQPAS